MKHLYLHLGRPWLEWAKALKCLQLIFTNLGKENMHIICSTLQEIKKLHEQFRALTLAPGLVSLTF